MPYVMVPVPEAYVDDVMRFALRLASKDRTDTGPDELDPWDRDSITRLLGSGDDRTRAVLRHLAREDNAGREILPRELGEALGLDTADIAGIVGPLSRKAKSAGRRPLILSKKSVVRDAEGVRRTERRLRMPDDTARLVRSATDGS